MHATGKAGNCTSPHSVQHSTERGHLPAQTWRVMSKTLATLNVLASKMLMMASSLKHGCPEVSSCRKHRASAFLRGRQECNLRSSHVYLSERGLRVATGGVTSSIVKAWLAPCCSGHETASSPSCSNCRLGTCSASDGTSCCAANNLCAGTRRGDDKAK